MGSVGRGAAARHGRRAAIAAAVAALSSGLLVSLPARTAVAVPAATDDLAPSAIEQIEAIQEDKESWTEAEQKLESDLVYEAREARGEPAVEGVPSLHADVEREPDGRVLVDVDATVDDALLDRIVELGGEVASAVPELDAVRVALPISAVETLAEEDAVGAIRVADGAATASEPSLPSEGPVTQSVGAGASEAEVVHRADIARALYGVDGTGVKVCVLSDGINSLASRQATGDLPAVDVLLGQAGSGDEGTAMLELIHDMAPGAELGFATAFSGVASFAQNIRDLRTAGCDIIVDDVFYFNEMPFQDGPIAQAVNDVTADGALYFSSAGNEGNLDDGRSGTWVGAFANGGSLATVPGGNVHDFGAGVVGNAVTEASPHPTTLFWSDALGQSGNDYDLYVLNSTMTSVVDASTNVQDGNDDPFEIVAAPSAGERLVVLQRTGAQNRHIGLYNIRGLLDEATSGAIKGHAAAQDAFAVAAAPAHTAFGGIPGSPAGPFPGPFTSASLSELYTSDGPTHIFYDEDGTPLNGGAGVTRQKPDITAADGTTTTTPGFIPFYGTSAAAPNAAAIAALMVSAVPTATPAQLRTALVSSAIDIEAPGVDSVTGAGIVMADNALGALDAPFQPVLDATVAVDDALGDDDGIVEPGERVTIEAELTNGGGAGATAIEATLTSASPEAVVQRATAAYGDLAVATSGTPTSAPLQVYVDADCECGQALDLTLTVTYARDGGPAVPSPLVVPLSMLVGEPGPAVSTPYSGGPVPIPDNNTTGATATIAVADIGAISDLTVSFDGAPTCGTSSGLAHTFVGDLVITLTSPSGTTVTLLNRAGGINNSGNHLCGTVLDDGAASSIQTITNGQAPFTGSFRPAEPLSAFAGEPSAGVWTLRVSDRFGGDIGTINAVSLHIAPAACTFAAEPNAVPVGAADSYSTPAGTALNDVAPGVLGNDTDADGDPLTVSVADGPDHAASFDLAEDGSFSYTPAGSFAGTDTFTYTPTDGIDAGDPVTVTVNVTSSGGGGGGGGGGTPTPEPEPTAPRLHDCATAGFTDVDPASVHADAVDCAVAGGLLRGTADGAFAPGGLLSRAQLATIVAQTITLAGGGLPASPPDAFGDDEGSVHEHAISQLAAVGLIGGKAPGVYDPAGTVTRGQLVTLLVGVVELLTGATLPEPADHFADDNGDAHERHVNQAFELGLVSGRGDGTFGAGEPVRRAQAASFLIRLLDALLE